MSGPESSQIFKALLVLFLSGFIPLTAVSFLLVRRSKKVVEFARVVDLLGIAADHVEFARNRVAEQYAAIDFRLPVLFAWLVCLLGFISLLFGADLVSEKDHQGKINFLLTGIAHLKEITEIQTKMQMGMQTIEIDNLKAIAEMQMLRVEGMVVMSIAFIGAFLWSAQNVLYRLNAGDLAPSVYFSSGLRMILAPILSVMILHLVTGVETLKALHAGLPAIAFLVGWFPDRALLFLREQFSAIFHDARSANSLPLSMIEGISTFDRARLSDLGISDAQNLAYANFIELVVRTAFNPGQIIDWIGQAQLYIYFDDEILLLRKHQVRTVFDMILIGRDPEVLEKLAAATSINAMGLRLFCERKTREPGVEQLLWFQRRLCAFDSAQGQGKLNGTDIREP